MKKLIVLLLMMFPMVMWGQTFSKETILWTGIKDNNIYELLKVINTNGNETVVFAVANNDYFPYDNLEIVLHESPTKIVKFINKILELNEKMEDGMSYNEEKNNFFAKKYVKYEEEYLYVSTDMEKFHVFQPKMLKITLECLESYIADPQNPKIKKMYF